MKRDVFLPSHHYCKKMWPPSTLLDHWKLTDHHRAQTSSSALAVDRRTIYASLNQGLELVSHNSIETGTNSRCIRRDPDRHVQMDDVVVDDDQISATFKGAYVEQTHGLTSLLSYKAHRLSYDFDCHSHHTLDSAGNLCNTAQSIGAPHPNKP